MGSSKFAEAVLSMMYTTTLITFTSLQLMGFNQANSVSNADVLPNAQYFFYQTSEYPKDCSEIQRQCPRANSSGVYLIKPHGFREPFEVFCNNDIDSEGWTVIQRREHGVVNFNRSWTRYEAGFGFLSTDFFIGNEKLAYLTNQADYELLFEAELQNGCSFYTSFKGFRITDEFGQYTLQPVGYLESNASECLSGCPANVFFINDCTEMCSCTDGLLNNCGAVSCDDNAICDVINDIEMCSCKDGYAGDGLTCTKATTTVIPTTNPPYRDCQEVLDAGETNSGMYTIVPNGWSAAPFNVYCEMDNDHGWTVFQRRVDGTPDFFQNWESYKDGFGEVTDSFWLGNEKLYHLTIQKTYILRYNVTHSNGQSRYADYTDFEIGPESTNYTLETLGSYSGTRGSNFAGYSLGKQFSTYDRDNDACDNFNCAEGHRSGWWHSDIYCSFCFVSFCYYFPYGDSSCHSICTNDNLNGVYNGGNGEQIFSYYCEGQNVEMKIRPVSAS